MAIITVKNRAIDLNAAEIPNLDASKITTGTFADARIAASNVSQHATSFDDNKIVNDISTLGLRVHTQENLNASNTNSASFDVFQDSSGITNLTNAVRNASEYIDTTITGASYTPTAATLYKGSSTSTADGTSLSIASGTGIVQFGNSIVTTGVGNVNSNYGMRIDLGANRTLTSPLKWIFRSKQYPDNTPQNYNAGVIGLNFSTGTSSGFVFDDDSNIIPTITPGSAYTGGSWSNSGWDNWQSNGYLTLPKTDGDTFMPAHYESIYHRAESGAYSNIDTEFVQYAWSSGTATGRYLHVACNTTYGEFGEMKIEDANGSIITPWTVLTISATGSFEGATITAGASTSKMGAVITYQDNAGTNALNTDIILKLSADNGSNYSTATLTALPDFASGIKCAKVNDLSVTAGTQLKYKIEFANQASGSKEARIRGVSLQY